VAGRGTTNLALALVQALSFSRVFKRWKRKATLLSIAACLAAVALIALLAAMVCAVAALWIYLIPYAGPVGAPAIVAGALLALCLILSIAAYFTARHKPRVPGSEFASAIWPLIEAVLAGFALGNKTKKAKAPPKDE
jgi:hypothetical protein